MSAEGVAGRGVLLEGSAEFPGGGFAVFVCPAGD